MDKIYYVDHSSGLLITKNVFENGKTPSHVVVDTIFDSVNNIRGHDAVVHWTEIGRYLNSKAGGEVKYVLWNGYSGGATFASRYYHRSPDSGHIAIGCYSRERDIEWRKLPDGYQVSGGWLIEDGQKTVKVGSF